MDPGCFNVKLVGEFKRYSSRAHVLNTYIMPTNSCYDEAWSLWVYAPETCGESFWNLDKKGDQLRNSEDQILSNLKVDLHFLLQKDSHM